MQAYSNVTGLFRTNKVVNESVTNTLRILGWMALSDWLNLRLLGHLRGILDLNDEGN